MFTGHWLLMHDYANANPLAMECYVAYCSSIAKGDLHSAG